MGFELKNEKQSSFSPVFQNNVPSGEKAEILGNFHKCESELLRRRRSKISVESFQEIDQLGIGGFGEVKLVRFLEDNKLHAMKVLNKNHILKKNQVT